MCCLHPISHTINKYTVGKRHVTILWDKHFITRYTAVIIYLSMYFNCDHCTWSHDHCIWSHDIAGILTAGINKV